MSTLRNNLTSLRAKLQNIQVQLEEATSTKAIKESKLKSLEERLNELNTETEIIKINVGGKTFSTRKDTLLKDPQCIFALLLEGEYKNKILLDNELFFDRSPRMFGYLLDYLRHGKINYKRFCKDELLELYEEATFYEVSDVRDYLQEKTKDIKLVSFKFSGEYIYNSKMAGTNKLSDLTDKSLSKGICCNSPGFIEFELNSTWEFETLEIGGYKGNTSIWYPGNGAGAQILVSENGREWKKAGNISPKFSKEIVQIKLDSLVTAKYIKFLHSSYLGIGYLNIEKNE